MFQVRLLSFPRPRHERLERIVQKHSGGKLDHPQREAVLHAVASGRPQVVARYAERHAAENAALELRLLDAIVEVREDEAGAVQVTTP